MVAYFILCRSEFLSEPCKRWFLAYIRSSFNSVLSSRTFVKFIYTTRNASAFLSSYRNKRPVVTVGSAFEVPRISRVTRGQFLLFQSVIVSYEWIQMNPCYQGVLPPPVQMTKSPARRRSCPIRRHPRRRRSRKR